MKESREKWRFYSSLCRIMLLWKGCKLFLERNFMPLWKKSMKFSHHAYLLLPHSKSPYFPLTCLDLLLFRVIKLFRTNSLIHKIAIKKYFKFTWHAFKLILIGTFNYYYWVSNNYDRERISLRAHLSRKACMIMKRNSHYCEDFVLKAFHIRECIKACLFASVLFWDCVRHSLRSFGEAARRKIRKCVRPFKKEKERTRENREKC
jgi:hypothetical protein